MGLGRRRACAQDAEGAKRAAGMHRGHGGTWEGSGGAHKAQRGWEGGGGMQMVQGGMGVMAACACWYRCRLQLGGSVAGGHACMACTATPRWSGRCDTHHGKGGGVNVAWYYAPDDMYPDKMYPVCVAAFIVVCGDGGDVSCATCC
ncbi:hypothetical protein K439DRAFT_1617585 [Ramaria rubella]|nr:hypothetical protein K439DRAFT_1617585 [Ramaria rubella]